jgi:predicted Zn-dependent protease
VSVSVQAGHSAGLWLRRLAAGLALLVAAGCTADRMGIPTAKEQVPLPPAVPRTAGQDANGSREHRKLVAMFGGEYKAPQAEKMLNDVVNRVALASDRPDQTYRVTVLNSPVVNAFALQSGNLYVTRGLLALANDTAEIAAVMAHEIAHVTASHATQRAELERRSEIVSRVVSEVLDDPVAGAAVQVKSQFSLASFSRAQELEADEIGVRTIAKAGYDPYGAARFLASLGRQSAMRATLLGEKPGQQNMNFLSTHPSTPERVSRALMAARQIAGPGIGESDRQKYLSAIDGIAFGDDPSEGMVRGQRFVHPQLGFTFTAPNGFVLENSATAVVGVTPGGAQALRFDSVKLPAGSTLASYLKSGWIEGVATGDVEEITVNGLPAVTAQAQGEEWTFRMAAVQSGGATYRFIFATKAMTPEIDRAMRQSVESFRLLTQEEAEAVRPLRIAVVTAKAGEGAEALASRMASIGDRPAERFQVLNGLDRSAPVKAGGLYKIVVE